MLVISLFPSSVALIRFWFRETDEVTVEVF